MRLNIDVIASLAGHPGRDILKLCNHSSLSHWQTVPRSDPDVTAHQCINSCIVVPPSPMYIMCINIDNFYLVNCINLCFLFSKCDFGVSGVTIFRKSLPTCSYSRECPDVHTSTGDCDEGLSEQSLAFLFICTSLAYSRPSFTCSNHLIYVAVGMHTKNNIRSIK